MPKLCGVFNPEVNQVILRPTVVAMYKLSFMILVVTDAANFTPTIPLAKRFKVHVQFRRAVTKPTDVLERNAAGELRVRHTKSSASQCYFSLVRGPYRSDTTTREHIFVFGTTFETRIITSIFIQKTA
jgi:hypothetical protein